ncbi:MAG TPA: hypothetical protein VFU35_14590 [Jatrophihabitans sp.]|nr:hypothetical protein [Jatrophihabitans sp.]
MTSVDRPAAAPGAPGRRERILHLLRTSTHPRSVLSLAGELGVHPNTVRFHLDALLRGGQVEQTAGETAGPGRPPALFRATHRMNPAGPTNYRLLARMLTSHLAASSRNPAAEAIALGRWWAPRILDLAAPGEHRPSKTRAVRRVVGALDDLGFAPEQPTGPRDDTIRLRHCPFLDLVDDRDDRRVICSLHLGLLQGAFRQVRGPVTVDRLEPFAEPDLCVAHLTSGSPQQRGSRRT